MTWKCLNRKVQSFETEQKWPGMQDVTQILNQIQAGNPLAANELLPLVYEELRKLAAQKMAQEKPGQTLQATALVHEAYLRLVGTDVAQRWDSRGHFFGAAAEAMRRILIDGARRKARYKHGGDRQPIELDRVALTVDESTVDLLALDEALRELEIHDAQAAQLVKLRFFGGLGHSEAAEVMGIERRAADRLWVLARAWLFRSLSSP